MMKYNFYAILSGLLILSICSCNRVKIEYHDMEIEDCEYMLLTQKGERLWGVVSQVGRNEIVPCQYDTIYTLYNKEISSDWYNNDMFVAEKDGKKFVYTLYGDVLFGGKNVTGLTYYKYAQHNQALTYPYNEAVVDGEIIFFHKENSPGCKEWGPAEKLFEGERSIMIKKGGKWAIYYKIDKKYLSGHIYDSVLEVVGPIGLHWLVKKDGKWSAFNILWQPANLPKDFIDRITHLPIIPINQYDENITFSYRYQRVGYEDGGFVRYHSNSGY